ncbi:MAG TPA: hypothetical protein VG820_01425 [Fimbriimonadaceae bacterium]|nr:hypothetical protein [Fimbriimonadaceae bacterium]
MRVSILALALTAGYGRSSATQYLIQQLGSYPANSENFGIAINDLGEVAGAGWHTAWRWTPSGGFQYFDGLLGQSGDLGVVAINNSGVALLRQDPTTGSARASLHVPGQSVQEVGFLGSGAATYPLGLNDRNEVIGWGAQSGAHYSSMYYWSSATGPIDPSGFLGFGDPSGASVASINDLGQMAGYFKSNSTSYSSGWIWSPSGGLQFQSDSHDIAFTSINNLGDGIGNGNSNFTTTWFYYHNGVMTYLPPPSHYRFYPQKINDSGTVLGTDAIDPYLWTPERGFERITMANIANRGTWIEIHATDMNNKGQLVGVGRTLTDNYAFFVMTPIAHPSPPPTAHGW